MNCVFLHSITSQLKVSLFYDGVWYLQVLMSNGWNLLHSVKHYDSIIATWLLITLQISLTFSSVMTHNQSWLSRPCSLMNNQAALGLNPTCKNVCWRKKVHAHVGLDLLIYDALSFVCNSPGNGALSLHTLHQTSPLLFPQWLAHC